MAKPLHQWIFDSAHFRDGHFRDPVGALHGKLGGEAKFYQDAEIEYLELDGMNDVVRVSDDISKLNLPTAAITVEAVVRFRAFGDWLAVLGAFQDNGNDESGWLMGLTDGRLYFALVSEGKKQLTVLQSGTTAVPGKWYHVAGTYDGAALKLYVDGQLVNSATDQSGKIFYPPQAWLTIGAYHDQNEYNLMTGSLRLVTLDDQALSADEIHARYLTHRTLTELPPQAEIPTDFLVKPYLQFATPTSVTLLWETHSDATSFVEFGEAVPLTRVSSLEGRRTLHEVQLEGLQPETNYFYRVRSENKNGRKSVSQIYSFQTVVNESTAYAFGVVSDTQNNPKVWGRIAELLFGERPNFVVHAGDIVGNGQRKVEWTDEFLAPAHVLMSRVPIYAILGNHDDDAKHYYNYLVAPEPEHYYTFTYGNAQFFMIDSDRKVAPGSELHTWLENALRSSTAQWKFAVHHHPPYSSDENDYGDTWKGPSERGDLRLKPLVALYEKYKLDICFFGHIHDYERTWPLRQEKVNRENGVIYLQTGGAGGNLENYAPTRSWFTAKVHRDHNYIIVAIHENELQLQAIDWNGQLFDVLNIKK
jgi:predicted phosphodiesterase